MKVITLIFTITCAVLSFGQSTPTEEFIDSIVAHSMSNLPQAGVAIGVVKDGKIIHLKGYGVASVETEEAVDANTMFAIASNSKAFTAVGLAILVDRGVITWQDKVVKHIPEFKMYDPYVTDNFTILDLLTHRSGLGLGAGDLMLFPDGNDFTIDDIINSFQYQTPNSPFRTKYDYDNLLYIVAGELTSRLSGKTWPEFINDEIFSKLGMSKSAVFRSNIKSLENIAEGHKSTLEKVTQIAAFDIDGGVIAIGSAGGIYSNATDMCQWMMTLLHSGKYGDSLEHELISENAHNELWKTHTMLGNKVKGSEYYNNHYDAYGLGFYLGDQNGYTVVDHTGSVPGMLSKVTMIPEMNVGIVVLTNSAPGGISLISITNEIKDEFLGLGDKDWIEWAEELLNNRKESSGEVVDSVWAEVAKASNKKVKFKTYVGHFKDDWFGEIEIYEKNNELWFKSKRSPKLHGQMQFYKDNTFAIMWPDRDLECDALTVFELDNKGIAQSFTMKGISPSIDFSYDFQDLDLQRIK